ncbi:MAG: sugar ABC transporter permease [Lachnospiraceae bacterium]|nr:sugar ABC transporter permease [Lachnospiraceae bacterium]
MKKKKSYDYARFGYIFSIPFVVAWCIFQLYPILYTLVIGFTDLKGIGTKNFHVLWTTPFANFTQILTTPSFQTAFKNTVFIWLMNFVPQIVLALVITAWFTDRRSTIKAQGFFKVIFYLPNIITAATVAILFAQFFQYPKGVINDVLINLGIFKNGAVDMLQKKWVAQGIVIFIQTWMWYGYTAIVMISGVLGISPELFEAAEVDGANQVQTFFRITIPSIKTMLLFTLVTSLIGGLNMFDIPKLFLNGKPDNSTLTTAVFIYNQAFAGSYLYNRAAAASVIMFIVIVVLSAIVFYLLRDKDEVALRKLIRQQEKAYKRKQKGL